MLPMNCVSNILSTCTAGGAVDAIVAEDDAVGIHLHQYEKIKNQQVQGKQDKPEPLTRFK